MPMKSLFLFFIFLLLSTAQANSSCIENRSENGVIHISKIDLNCPNLELITTLPKDQGLTVSEFAGKYQTNVAINGSFFRKDLSPLGLNISQFKKWQKSNDTLARSFLACTANHHCHIDPINRITSAKPNWKLALAGWHYYSEKSGKFECSTRDKIGCSQDIFTGKHPRTMIGLDEKHNWLYLVVVEGRQLTYRGMTMNELAQLATQLKLTYALNLDGGGSSTMVIDNKRISALPLLQGSERKVANHFGVRLQQ
ncbi:hypothetical protein A1D25_00830 [Ursidibacter arcticus]|nr:hypothetical protein A1D25_00830 [Ursidibacter arcticus]